ncbi:MAG: M13 family metallopeptidase [Terriglobia bacterium]
MRIVKLIVAVILVVALSFCAGLALRRTSLAHGLRFRGGFFARGATGRGAAAAATAVPGLNLRNLNPKVKPCSNFFEYADGGWIASHPIPADRPSWGTFVALAQHNQDVLNGILKTDAAAKAPSGSNERKLGEYYSSCMDTKAIDAAAAKPLDPEFARIAAIQNVAGLQAEIARLQKLGVNAAFRFGPQQDSKNSTEEIAVAAQGGLGLPNRDYYTKQDAKSKQIRGEYVAHVAKMFELLGDPASRAAAEAVEVMKIETELADASMTPVARRNPEAVYHRMSVASAGALTPHFSWTQYYREVGAPSVSSMNVAQPDFFKVLNTALTSVPLANWKTYLRWHLIDATAPALSQPFEDEAFNFHGRELLGVQKLQPRWQRCVGAVDRGMGMALGAQYVKTAFPPAAKARAVAMVNNLVAELRSDISTLPWMSPQTRRYALAKLQHLAKQIGYPSKWRDYSSLDITSGPYVANVLRARAFEFRREINKIGKPVDRTEWGMTPPTVNAYYTPHMNEIVFPAGILQPPFFNPDAPDAINYGAMGVVIGHEMTHGFDDEGSRFDADGNLRNWWTPEDYKQFKQRAQCIVNQFNGYVVADHLHENGQLVQGESIADLGGLTIAYKALEKSLAGKQHTKTDGFTPEQLFFLGYAQIWASSIRPQSARASVLSNPHPLARFRVNGPLSNMPAFAHAWQCSPGSAMVRPPNEQCKIW